MFAQLEVMLVSLLVLIIAAPMGALACICEESRVRRGLYIAAMVAIITVAVIPFILWGPPLYL